MKRALLTGGSGFIGANLARRLLAAGYEVHLALRPDHSSWRIREVRDDLRLHMADLRDHDAMAGCIAEARPDVVFHLAAYGAYPEQTDFQSMVETNIIATAALLEACARHGVGTVVNAGSSSEYGFVDHAPREDELLRPNSNYAITKSCSTDLCRLASDSHGIKAPTLRLYSAYGPWEEPTRLIPTLIRFGKERKLPPLVKPEVARDFVYVDDVCEAFILAATKSLSEPAAIYNVGTGVQTTIREVVALARELMRIEEEPKWGAMPDRQWDTTTWKADPSKIQRELGWQPKHDLRSGLEATLAWSEVAKLELPRAR